MSWRAGRACARCCVQRGRGEQGEERGGATSRRRTPHGSTAWSRARYLVGAYGSEAAAVLNLVERDRALGQPIVAGRPEVWAEVTHAVEREMALRLSDVLIRRLHLFYTTRDQAVSAAGAVADRM